MTISAPTTLSGLIDDSSANSTIIKLFKETLDNHKSSSTNELPRLGANKQFASQISITAIEMHGTRDMFSMARDAIERLGRNIASGVDKTCIDCSMMKSEINAYQEPIRDQTNIRASCKCTKLPGDMCPDQVTIGMRPENIYEYSMRPEAGYGSPIVVKEAPKVNMAEIELEIKRLDTNYGLF